MKLSCISVTIKAGVGICLLLLVGCASSPPSHYYVLNALEGKAPDAPCVSVGVGPVKLPEYVNRLQIVNRTSPNEFTFSSFDLWAEPLTDSVPRMLAENISRLICVKEVVLFPWRPSVMPDYRVEVEVLKMDGTLNGSVSLDAWWSVSHGKARVTRYATYSESVAGQNYAALVQAHSRALAALSKDIAETLKQF